MDTLLFLALSLGGVTAFMHSQYGLAGWLLAATVVTRIEGVGLAMLVGLAVVGGGHRPGSVTGSRR